ncbi:hypothetical protein KI387_035755, partial [Taxus chinensis]
MCPVQVKITDYSNSHYELHGRANFSYEQPSVSKAPLVLSNVVLDLDKDLEDFVVSNDETIEYVDDVVTAAYEDALSVYIEDQMLVDGWKESNLSGSLESHLENDSSEVKILGYNMDIHVNYHMDVDDTIPTPFDGSVVEIVPFENMRLKYGMDEAQFSSVKLE